MRRTRHGRGTDDRMTPAEKLEGREEQCTSAEHDYIGEARVKKNPVRGRFLPKKRTEVFVVPFRG